MSWFYYDRAEIAPKEDILEIFVEKVGKKREKKCSFFPIVSFPFYLPKN